MVSLNGTVASIATSRRPSKSRAHAIMTVSIIIKAWNEEKHIARAIESALSAIEAFGGEVIVADCGSGDGTVEIAAGYPVTVVQLADPGQRTCGLSPQLGYQYSGGRYVLLMDGDMALHPGFVGEAIAFLDRNPKVAGVGGVIVERNVDNLEFARRTRTVRADLCAGEVDRLNGGGLFRRAAIESVGYFTDRNLHSYEEFDLAARLRAAGWSLHRLDRPAVDHYGHTENGYVLLWRRLTSGYAFGIGEVVRAGLQGGRLAATFRGLHELRIWLAVLSGWVLIAAVALSAPGWLRAASALLIAAPFAGMILRHRSVSLGIYAVVAWQVHTLGLLIGLLRPRIDPGAWIESRVVSSPTHIRFQRTVLRKAG